MCDRCGDDRCNDPDSKWCSDILLMRYKARAEALSAEVAEQQAAFDLRWNADMRAIKKWQRETGRDLTWPDHTDLCVWLIKRVEALEKDAVRYRWLRANRGGSRSGTPWAMVFDDDLEQHIDAALAQTKEGK